MAVYRNKVGQVRPVVEQDFLREVLQGLTAEPKYLPSKYFYDATGDRLFQQIMDLPEYYLTRCELEIFQMQTPAIAKAIANRLKGFDIIELGAGDATKSIHLLRYLKDNGFSFSYFPVDISHNIIRALEEELPQAIEGLQVNGLAGDYFDMIRKSYQVSHRRKVVLFLGSSIGNLSEKETIRFLTSLQENLRSGDLVLIGFDLRKDPRQILAAYDDRAGITRAFNLNLLHRINETLHADFSIENFDHFPTYNPETGECKSYLLSKVDQQVTIAEQIISFSAYETIWTEVSQKYSLDQIEAFARSTGFRGINAFFDEQQWFVDVLWEKK